MNEALANNGATPILSVVVVSFNDATLLAGCLAALVSQPGAQQVEIHVISKKRCPDVLPDSDRVLRIHWHQVDASATIPR